MAPWDILHLIEIFNSWLFSIQTHSEHKLLICVRQSQVHKINITKNNLLTRVCNVIEWIILFAGYWHFHWDLRASGQTGFIESPGQGVLTTSTYFSMLFWKRDTKYNPFQCWPVGDGINQVMLHSEQTHNQGLRKILFSWDLQSTTTPNDIFVSL